MNIRLDYGWGVYGNQNLPWDRKRSSAFLFTASGSILKTTIPPDDRYGWKSPRQPRGFSNPHGKHNIYRDKPVGTMQREPDRVPRRRCARQRFRPRNPPPPPAGRATSPAPGAGHIYKAPPFAHQTAAGSSGIAGQRLLGGGHVTRRSTAEIPRLGLDVDRAGDIGQTDGHTPPTVGNPDVYPVPVDDRGPGCIIGNPHFRPQFPADDGSPREGIPGAGPPAQKRPASDNSSDVTHPATPASSIGGSMKSAFPIVHCKSTRILSTRCPSISCTVKRMSCDVKTSPLRGSRV